jgi:hypothetical protein
MLGDDEMGGRTDRHEHEHALHDAQDEGFEDRHVGISPARGNRCIVGLIRDRRTGPRENLRTVLDDENT